MSTAKHTALPWHVKGKAVYSGSKANEIAYCSNPEDAALIVQVVNEREGLVRDAERLEAARKRVRELWQMVKVYNRAAPGSLDRGRDCSMEDALRSIETAMGSLQIKPMDAAIDAARGGDVSGETVRRYYVPLSFDNVPTDVVRAADYYAALARVKELEGVLKSIAENKLTGPSPIGPAHGAGISMGIEIQASIARAALSGARSGEET